MADQDIYSEAVKLHRQHGGKLTIASQVPLENKYDLSLAYTPGVAEPCRVIAKDPAAAAKLTLAGRTIAVVSDGTAVLGLGNIGAAAALPVMEGKSLLMKKFADVDSFPLVINAANSDEIVQFVRQVAPTFAGINLEDIAAPACFYIEDQLADLPIPVFHDDQHGTAIVVYAALLNAAQAVNKPFNSLKVVVVGAGAAGLAVSQLLLGLDRVQGRYKKVSALEAKTVAEIIIVDSKGPLSDKRTDLNDYKKSIQPFTNPRQIATLTEAVKGADVIIGVSVPETITKEMVSSMAEKAIVMAMANPTPEIMPDEARAAGAAIVATGRSDFPNQVNNVLAFPAIWRAVIDGRLPKITTAMKYAAARALANQVPNPTVDQILPDPFRPGLAQTIAKQIINK